MRLKRFKLSKGCDIQSIVLRETCGKDEEMAALKAEARGMKPGQIHEELLRLAVTEVDGKKVEYPFTGLSKWNTKTRNMVLAYFNDMNSVEEAELKSFLEEGEDLGDWVQPVAGIDPNSSGNG